MEREPSLLDQRKRRSSKHEILLGGLQQAAAGPKKHGGIA